MAKYETDFKLQLVQEYLSGRIGFKALSTRYGVSQTVLRGWVSRYQIHGEAGLSKKHEHYSAAFKEMVLRHMHQDALSCTEVAALYNIRAGGGGVAVWERMYHQGGIAALHPKPRGRRPMPSTPKPIPTTTTATTEARTIEELLKENEYLRTEVAYLKKLDELVRARQQAAPKKRRW